MLERLVIRNFAIIDDLTVDFGSGLNAVTGETGAGKSILIDALGAVLGERVGPDVVRTGAQRATIDAEFVVDDAQMVDIAPSLEENGIDAPDNHLLLTREIQATGRSSARINGRPVTAALLARVGDALVDIHGQSDHLSLLKRNRQRLILDAFGVDPELLATMASLVAEWRAARRALEDVTSNARATAQRIDLLKYQTEEIDSAGLQRGEDLLLEQEFARLSQVDRLASEIAVALQHIESDDLAVERASPGALAELRAADKAIGDSAEIDQSLKDLSSQHREVVFLLDDVVLELKRYQAGLEANPARLEEVGDRIARLRDLKRKYGATIEDVLAYQEHAAAELATLTSTEFDELALRAREANLQKQVTEAGRELTDARILAATQLTDAAREAIGDLQLGGASFSIDVRSRAAANPGTSLSEAGSGSEASFDEFGFDLVEFLFAPNAGEAPRPLAKIASGGEMARMMLALKAIIAAADTIPTLVFDEVDVGVGGRSGSIVGGKLRGLAEQRQVLVISHLPQVAGYADRHLRIRKEVRDGRTFSTVEALEEADRLEELAAMLDGEPVTDASRTKALEMMRRIAPESPARR